MTDREPSVIIASECANDRERLMQWITTFLDAVSIPSNVRLMLLVLADPNSESEFLDKKKFGAGDRGFYEVPTVNQYRTDYLQILEQPLFHPMCNATFTQPTDVIAIGHLACKDEIDLFYTGVHEFAHLLQHHKFLASWAALHLLFHEKIVPLINDPDQPVTPYFKQPQEKDAHLLAKRETVAKFGKRPTSDFLQRNEEFSKENSEHEASVLKYQWIQSLDENSPSDWRAEVQRMVLSARGHDNSGMMSCVWESLRKHIVGCQTWSLADLIDCVKQETKTRISNEL